MDKNVVSKHVYELFLSPGELLSESEAYNIQMYLLENFGKTEIRPFPKKWEGVNERIYIGRLAELVFGENKADHWLQNVLFAHFGKEEEVKQEVPADLTSISNTNLFLELNPNIIDNLYKRYSRYFKTLNDQDIYDEISDAIYAAFSPSNNSDKLDYRVSFILYYDHCIPFEIKNFLINAGVRFSDDVKITDDQKKAWLNGDENGLIAYSDINGAKSLSKKIKLKISNMLIDKYETLIDNKIRELIKSGSKDTISHVHYLSKMNLKYLSSKLSSDKNSLSSYSQGTMSYDCEMDDEEKTFISYVNSYSQVISEDGETLTEEQYANKNHTYMRSSTDEDKKQNAKVGKEYLNDIFKKVRNVAIYLSNKLRSESMIKGSFSQSDRLNYILPDQIEVYIETVIKHAKSIIDPENDEQFRGINRKGVIFTWKTSGKSIKIINDGVPQIFLSSKIINKALAEKTRDRRVINDMINDGFSDVYISNETGLDLAFVKSTIRGIKKFRSNGESYIAQFRHKNQASRFKADFAHRWTKLMPYLFECNEDGVPMYKVLGCDGIHALMTILPVHKYISEGTIPKSVFYDTKTGSLRDNPSIGKATGWSINKKTQMSNTEMYYTLIGEGIDNNSRYIDVYKNREIINNLKSCKKNTIKIKEIAESLSL